MAELKGAQGLAGAVIESAQVLPVALAVLSELGIQIDDERDPPPTPLAEADTGPGPSAGSGGFPRRVQASPVQPRECNTLKAVGGVHRARRC